MFCTRKGSFGSSVQRNCRSSEGLTVLSAPQTDLRPAEEWVEKLPQDELKKLVDEVNANGKASRTRQKENRSGCKR